MKITFGNHEGINIDKKGLVTREIVRGELYVAIYMGDDIKLWITKIPKKGGFINFFLGEFATAGEVSDYLKSEEFQRHPYSFEISKEVKSYLAI